MACHTTVVHIPYYLRLMDDETSNKRQSEHRVTEGAMSSVNTARTFKCSPSTMLQPISPDTQFRNKDPELENPRYNNQYPSSLSALTTENPTKANSPTASPQNQQVLMHSLPINISPAWYL